MSETARHQCFIYEGSPLKHLPKLAAELKRMLKANYRCLYLNNPTMMSEMRSHLISAGVDVLEETASGRLILSSVQGRPADGAFDGEEMLKQLEETVHRSLQEGYAGLWATGDMSWEIGEENDPLKLLKYEWGLEELFRRQPALCGICQYHVDTLPSDMSRQALLSHKSVFLSETLSRLNPFYIPPASFAGDVPPLPELIEMLALLDRLEPSEKE